MKGKGYQTKSRQEILNYFAENTDGIVTASSIYSHMEKVDCKVNITTIYRCLDRLVEEGIVIKYASEKGDKCGYQYVPKGNKCHDHLHMQCVKCGKVVHLDCEFMNEFKGHIATHHGFTLQCDTSILYGICDQCKKGE